MRMRGSDARRLWLGLAAAMLVTGADADAPAAAPIPAPAPALTNLVVAPDLADELAKFQRVRMPFDASALNAREGRMIGKLVEACRYLDRIYWQQSDPEGWQLYQQLRG